MVMKIAVVHDYFTQLGGAEKVAEELYNMFPSADLLATVALKDKMPESLQDVHVITSWMQHLPQMRKFYRLYFPLYPFGVSGLDLSQYELIISSSSGYAKGVRVASDAIHVCYCHTPMRWVWSFDSYSSREKFGHGIKALLPSLIGGLRTWDEAASRQPDHFVANSRTIASRILRVYGRYAEVIAPPIDINRFSVGESQEEYYIVLARLVPYKRIDLAIDACTRLGRRLIVIGSGTAKESLTRTAGPTIKFLGRISEADVVTYVTGCRALIFPGEEDFGMAPVEVAAAGRPTIAFGQGGALETIVEDVTGVFFREQTVESVMDAILRFEKQGWTPSVIREHAESFSTQAFQRKFRAFLQRVGVDV